MNKIKTYWTTIQELFCTPSAYTIKVYTMPTLMYLIFALMC